MAMLKSVDNIIMAVFGAVLIFYLVSETFDDAATEIDSINDNLTGAGLIKLTPLFLAFGVVIGVFYLFMKGK